MGQELRDTSGKVIGYFFTTEDYKKMEYDAAWREFELQRQLDEARGVKRTYDGTNGMTTTEAIEYLERLGREAKEGK
jgi:hypothetical protein